MDDLSLAHSRYNCTYHIELRREMGEILGKICRMEEV